MSYLTMPVHSDIPCYQFQIALEGTTYTLDFEWNERGQFWTMHLSDQDENPIVTGIKLCVNISLLDKYNISGLPPGDFILIDTSGSDADPLVGDLGGRVMMYYRESTTPAGT